MAMKAMKAAMKKVKPVMKSMKAPPKQKVNKKTLQKQKERVNNRMVSTINDVCEKYGYKLSPQTFLVLQNIKK